MITRENACLGSHHHNVRKFVTTGASRSHGFGIHSSPLESCAAYVITKPQHGSTLVLFQAVRVLRVFVNNGHIER